MTHDAAASIYSQLMDLRAVSSFVEFHINKEGGSIKTYCCMEGMHEASQSKDYVVFTTKEVG